MVEGSYGLLDGRVSVRPMCVDKVDIGEPQTLKGEV
jgi:hypothetical protein